MQNLSFFKIRHNFLKTYFFLSAIAQWNNLDLNKKSSSSLNIFRNSILKFVKPSADSVFNSNNPKAYHKTKACSESLAGSQIQAKFSRFTKPNF